jgi:hypothetical protein
MPLVFNQGWAIGFLGTSFPKQDLRSDELKNDKELMMAAAH